ncbi:hypothetical protein E2C01_044120 [Portunus trituberculatus]|uniref:Uncharacterized protein n=1 Tax=Portunus trituberculatus TaxID=210409 RepID=A0A5B7FXI6_PORTR|nr:hypothetical protein [Portunus trituberculatus]
MPAVLEYMLRAGLITLALGVFEEEEEARQTARARSARRRLWSREWLRRRQSRSQYRTLVQELAFEDPASYQNPANHQQKEYQNERSSNTTGATCNNFVPLGYRSGVGQEAMHGPCYDSNYQHDIYISSFYIDEIFNISI